MFDNKEGDEKGRKLDNIEQKHIEDAYGSSELDSERRPTIPGTRALLIVGLIVIVAVPIALTWKAFKMHNTAEVEEENHNKQYNKLYQAIPPDYRRAKAFRRIRETNTNRRLKLRYFTGLGKTSSNNCSSTYASRF